MTPKSWHNDHKIELKTDPKCTLQKDHFWQGRNTVKQPREAQKCAIRGQGRKALAYDASNKFVHIAMKRDAFCLISSQNNRETYQCMHRLSLICCKVVLLTPWLTHAASTDAVHTLPSQILLAHIRMSRSYAVFARGFHVFPPPLFSLTVPAYHVRQDVQRLSMLY